MRLAGVRNGGPLPNRLLTGSIVHPHNDFRGSAAVARLTCLTRSRSILMSVLHLVMNGSARFGSPRGTACRVAAGLSLLAVVLAGGCGRSGKPHTVAVKGTVSYKGKPLTTGKVIFAPVDPQKGRPGEGWIGGDGSFAISTFDPGDGVVPGDYIVMIDPTPPPEESVDKKVKKAPAVQFPKKYLKKESSDLKQSIAEKVVDLKLELKD
jgi:hypothetical protein